jgi:hypothetical protein
VPIPEPLPLGQLCQLVAGAADLCRKPFLHAVRLREGSAGPAEHDPNLLDCTLLLEVRNACGERSPEHDLELELYTSGEQLHLTLAWAADPQRPMLWQGSHPVWMATASGCRCERPQDGPPVEALARRLRALLV